MIAFFSDLKDKERIVQIAKIRFFHLTLIEIHSKHKYCKV